MQRLFGRDPLVEQLGSAWQELNAHPREFWAEVWQDVLGYPVEVPAFPKLSPAVRQMKKRYRLMPIFITREYLDRLPPQGFVDLNIEQLSLPGDWRSVMPYAQG